MTDMTMRLRATTLATLLAAGASCALAQGSTLLFSSGFEQGTALRPIDQGDCWATGCFQRFEGSDATTGFAWPPAIWGGGALLFLLADAPVDAATIGDYFSQQIVTATGRRGSPTRVLYSLTTQSGCCGADGQLGGATAANLLLAPLREEGDLYVSYWLKLQPEAVPVRERGGLDPQDPQHWRFVFSWKTGSAVGIDDGDYRVILNIASWNRPGAPHPGRPYWEVRGDNAAGADPNYVEFWRVENRGVPVPLGEWFKFEAFWHRSTGDDGRIWMAVNGQVIADRAGPNRIARDINRIALSGVYSGEPYPLYQWLDDLQIWSGFPPECADPPCAPR
ncbi:MAG TPA: hypothetical protein VFB53_04355 [Burkholderiales bacterium]|nr:hypothetical protein [Burkholderiales bacterium]